MTTKRLPHADLFTRAAQGFVRVAAVSPELKVADVTFNVGKIREALAQAQQQGVQLVVFPELCITGYSCGDLFHQSLLLSGALRGLVELAEATRKFDIAAVVGLPLEVAGRLFNVAALLAGGQIIGLVPKRFLPTYGEFYEQRWFTSLTPDHEGATLNINGAEVPFGSVYLFVAANMHGCILGLEVCEDLWAVEPPSGKLAIHGATLLVNPSASPDLLGKADYRRELVRQQSARTLSAYLYAGSGPGESTTDLVFAGHSLLAENGTLLAETERFRFATQMVVVDIDVQKLLHERMKNTTFTATTPTESFFRLEFTLPRAGDALPPLLHRPTLVRMPFVPADPAQRARHCREIFALQATGLAKRLRHTGLDKVTIGLSGGLDSTLALLVIVRAFDMLNLPHAGILAITMPGFGTTARTRGNAEKLAELLGLSLRVIPIGDAVLQHFRDIGHDPAQHDVTYENAQARERTQILMDVANKLGGLVVGTGDLSEAALGWMTFNGDHMSMYHVNAGVPKTLVRYLVSWCAEELFSGETAAVLNDIVATPITPELLPLSAGQQLEQKTEETIGPYELHDFFLFHTVRYPFGPAKVYTLARQAFGERYDSATLLKWLATFYRRFFSQQFKRSAMPDGPKVGSVALSPRGDWRMPSDASPALWLAEVERVKAWAERTGG
jgi:NAD+ synthase (glutamine-hydrolysing)